MLALTSLSLTSLATTLPDASHAVLVGLQHEAISHQGNGSALISGACFCQEGSNWRRPTNKLIKLGKFTPVRCPLGGRSDKRASNRLIPRDLMPLRRARHLSNITVTSAVLRRGRCNEIATNWVKRP